MLRDEGITITKALTQLLSDLDSVKLIVGHNLAFDRHVIASELYRAKLDHKKLLEFPGACTMKMGKALLGRRYPKLHILYDHYFHAEIPSQHRALSDVRTTHEVYKKLKLEGAKIISDLDQVTNDNKL
jgi:DNA polymerase III epsilon subunit-like protein